MAGADGLHGACASVHGMPDPARPPALEPGSAPDGNRDLLRSGVWVAKPFVAVEAFPEALVLTEADRRLAPKLASPVRLCGRRVGAHVVELLLERAEDRTVALSLRIPTAENQFKDPYVLMEAEPGNTREIGVRELQFHLQGRLSERDVASADWAGYLAAAARKLESLRGSPRRGGKGRKPAAARRASRRASRTARRSR
jgi:hypothetical protein